MLSLSVIIPCFNEAHNMRAVLESVAWADEILVIDSFSTDETLAIAKEFNTTLLQREYINSANQKNWAIPQTTHDWILIVDADERVTPGLQQEIKELLQTVPSKVAYWIGRENYFMNKPVKYCGWQNDKVIRLFHKDKAKYEEKKVHAEMIADGPVGQLQQKLIHNTYKDISHFLAKMERYAHWSAEDYYPKTKKVTLYHLWGKPAFRFFKHYFLKLGFLDGRVGFIVSAIMAWGVFLRYVKIKEKQLSSPNSK